MILGQIRFQTKSTAAVFEGASARPIPGYSLVDLIRKSETESVALTALALEMASHHSEPAEPCIPLNPPEVWGAGCTFERSADFRDKHLGLQESLYAGVYNGPRPELFFKGTARVCVGPGQPIGIRADSEVTAPEPELAAILGRRGQVLGYTLANDVSAWDIGWENPLYLPQAKIYSASCALGPWIVTADKLPDPYNLELTCSIRRSGETLFTASISTANMRRKVEDLVQYLLRANPVPAGSVLLLGTGVLISKEAALQPGDEVTVKIPEIGELTNPTARVESGF